MQLFIVIQSTLIQEGGWLSFFSFIIDLIIVTYRSSLTVFSILYSDLLLCNDL